MVPDLVVPVALQAVWAASGLDVPACRWRRKSPWQRSCDSSSVSSGSMRERGYYRVGRGPTTRSRRCRGLGSQAAHRHRECGGLQRLRWSEPAAGGQPRSQVLRIQQHEQPHPAAPGQVCTRFGGLHPPRGRNRPNQAPEPPSRVQTPLQVAAPALSPPSRVQTPEAGAQPRYGARTGRRHPHPGAAPSPRGAAKPGIPVEWRPPRPPPEAGHTRLRWAPRGRSSPSSSS